RLIVGTFSAASNVTGALADVDAVTALLHRHGALACWDYATAAPYVAIDMNPLVVGPDQPFVFKDAVFFSGHKFAGGPGTPGILVAKKRLLPTTSANGGASPTAPGGGTVFFVTPADHRFLSNREEREEGGTPDVVGAVRLGLAVQLKQRAAAASHAAAAATTAASGIAAAGNTAGGTLASLAARGLAALRSHPNIVTGGKDCGRLPIFSFLIRGGGGGVGEGEGGNRFLHYNFVCALLNDLFGVQARGGCQCAGPFGMALLGLRWKEVRGFERALLRKHELLRPGWVRLSLSPYHSPEEVDYILAAVVFVAARGATFLPQYRADHKTGQWKHATRFTRFPERRWLGRFDYGLNGGGGSDDRVVAGESAAVALVADGEGERNEAAMFPRLLAEAEALAAELVVAATTGKAKAAAARQSGPEDMLDEESERLRWFLYPWEAAA
ncbi:unnamed protein product, partial [Phaeothamnion confervicola]